MKSFNKAVYDLLGAAVCMVLLPLIVGFAFYVYAHKGENPAAGPVLQLLAVVAIAAIAGAVLQWRAATLQLELMLCNERTHKQAEQFGGEPLDDPLLDASRYHLVGESFSTAPHPQMFLDLATNSLRFLPGTWLKRSEISAIWGQADYARLLRQAASTHRPATPREADNLSASEALFGFASWLTTRPGTLEIGAQHEAPQAAVLVAMFIEAQGLSDPAEDWPKRMVPMGDRDVKFSSHPILDDRQVGEIQLVTLEHPSGGAFPPPIQLTDCAPTFGVQPFSLGESLEEDLDADDLLPAPQLVPADEAQGPGWDVPTINRAPEDVPIDDAADLEAVDQALLRKRGGAE